MLLPVMIKMFNCRVMHAVTNGMNFGMVLQTLLILVVIRNPITTLVWEDNFMTFSPLRFKAADHRQLPCLIWNQKDDRHAMWIDRDQDGVFEGGSLEQMEPIRK